MKSILLKALSLFVLFALCFTTRFTVDRNAVHYTDAEGEPQELCGPLWVEADTRDERNESWGKLLRWIDREGKGHRWVMPLALLAGQVVQIFSRLLDGGLKVPPDQQSRNLMIEYIQEPAPKRLRCTSTIGWNGPSYVLPDETFSPSDAEEVIFQTPTPDKFVGLSCGGSLDGWREKISLLCIGNSRLLMAASIGFAGPLLQLANEQSGAVHIVGPSSDGKTTALRIAASVMGSQTMMKNWRATSNGLESQASDHNHLALLLDEMAQVDPHDAVNAIYMIGNETGKSRANQNATSREPYRWKTLVLSTGEITLSEHVAAAGKHVKAGAEVRCVNVPSDAGKGHRIFDDLHGFQDGASFANYLKDEVNENYGFPLRAFLRWMVENKADVEAALRPFIDDFVTKVAGSASPEVKRAARRFTVIAAAGEFASEAGITGWPRGEATWGLETCFGAYLEQRGSVGESDTEKAINRLMRFIEQEGASRFQQFDEKKEKIHKRAGFVRHTPEGIQYMFLPQTFREEICAGADHVRVAKELVSRDILVTGSDGYRKKVRVPALGNKPTDLYVVVLNEADDADA